MLWLVVGCRFEPGSFSTSDATPTDVALDVTLDATPDAALPQVLRVEAWMDGRSQLVFSGHSVHWHHYQYAAPGRELLVNKPTLFDDVAWLPTWPDAPDGENRDCDCDSSVYDQLPITIPSVPTVTTVTPIQARVAPSVIQQASAENGYTLIVELTDVGAGGSATHIVDISIAYE
jgi:hypothetical protein